MYLSCSSRLRSTVYECRREMQPRLAQRFSFQTVRLRAKRPCYSVVLRRTPWAGEFPTGARFPRETCRAQGPDFVDVGYLERYVRMTYEYLRWIQGRKDDIAMGIINRCHYWQPGRWIPCALSHVLGRRYPQSCDGRRERSALIQCLAVCEDILNRGSCPPLACRIL